MRTLATLRVCMSCEWVFKLPAPDGCPKCEWGHYGARYVYGNKAYTYARTQKPWFEKKMEKASRLLLQEIRTSQTAKTKGDLNAEPRSI